MRHTTFSSTAFALILLAPLGANAQTSSDNCSYAPANQYPVNASCVFTTFDKPAAYNPNYNPGTCNAGNNDDAYGWFQATATTTTVTYDPATSTDPVLHVFTGACGGPYTQIGCADANGNGGNETVTLTTTIGTNYLIRIQRWSSNLAMSGSICIYSTPPLVNNTCASATLLTPGAPGAPCSPLAQSSVGATQSIPAETCSGFTSPTANDVWYRFTATATTHTIIVTGSGGFDAVVNIRSGACNGTHMSCVDATTGNGTETLVVPGLTIGTQYYVRVYGWAGGTGSFDICITTPGAPPANNACASASPIAVLPFGGCPGGATTGTTAFATQDGPTPTCDLSGTWPDVWYSFNSGLNTTLSITRALGTATDLVSEVYSGACPGGTSVFCSFTTGTTNFTVTPNTNYRVRISSNTDFGATGTFTVCISALAAPACNGAYTSPANGSATCSDGSAATLSWPSAANAGAYDVYFDNAGGTTLVSADQLGTSYATGPLGPGTYSWRVVPKNGSGSAAGPCATWTFTRVAPPTTATAGGPQTICASGTSAALGGNTPVDGTGGWTIVGGGTGTFGPAANDPNATFTHTGGLGPVQLRWTISNPPCIDSFFDVFVTITPPPTAANAGGPQTICDGGTTAGLGGNAPLVGTGGWTIVGGGTGTFGPAANDPNATFTHTGGLGPVQLRWTISNPPCIDSFFDVFVTITPPPTAANAGGPQTICDGGTTAGLGGNAPLVGTGGWTIVGGGTGTFGPAANDPNAAFTHTGGLGPVQLRWTISNPPCIDSFFDVFVTITPPPTAANAGGPQTICDGGTTAGLGGNAPLVGTGGWTIVGGGTGTFGPAANDPNAAFTHTGGLGPVQLRWTISNPPCIDSFFDVFVTITPPPTAANAGGPQTICDGGTTAGLGGNAPLVGTGGWTIVGGGTGTFGPAANDPNAAFTHTGGLGPVQLRWTISNPPCIDSFFDVFVTITPPPTAANAGGPQTICDGGTTAGLGGNAPLVGTGGWTIVGGGTGTFGPAANDPNATFTHTGGLGPVQLRWTISNPPCIDSFFDVFVTITPPPTAANAGGPQTICDGGTTAGLGGNAPLVGTGGWTIVGGGTGTFGPAANDPNAAFTHTGGLGPVQLRWTISNPPCIDSFFDVFVTITPPPTAANAGGPQTICDGGTTAGLGGNAPLVGTGGWTIVGGGTGTFGPAANDPNAAFTHTGGLGPVQLRWTISNPPCIDSFFDVFVTITPPPTAANAGGPQTICDGGTTAGLGGNAPLVGTGGWTIVGGGTGTFGPAANDPNAAFTHTGGLGPVQLRWTISNPPCIDSFFDVFVTITPPPTAANAGGPQTICDGGTTAGLGGNAPLVGTGGWTIVGGGTGTFGPAANDPNAAFTHTGGLGPVQLRWTISNPPCIDSFFDVFVTINPLPVMDCQGPYGPYCSSDAPVALGGAPGSGIWSGPGVAGSTFDPSQADSGPNDVTYTYTDGNGCTNACIETILVDHLDTDGDITPDCLDGCPLDPMKTDPGACGCGVADDDSDGDATADCTDGCPFDPAKTAPGNCGCGSPEPGAACDDGIPTTGDDEIQNDCTCQGVPMDCLGIPGGGALPGTPCDDGNAGTVNDTWDGTCTCVGVPSGCASNDVRLDLTTDDSGDQTSWEIIPQGGGAPLCSGPAVPPYPDNTVINESCCLADGCYELRVLDSFGDGMCCANGVGGYLLRTIEGDRIIDNSNDGGFGTVSQIAAAQGFCVPLSTDRLTPSRCDLTNLSPGGWLQAVENSAVSAQYGVTNTTSGYQFWFFNPDGGYSRRIFISHAFNNYWFPTGPTRASYLNLTSIVTSPLPQEVLLNVRVRTSVAGTYGAFGPACRLTLGCTTTQLVDDIGSPDHSCGITGVVLDGSQFIHAVPVSGATKYQWEFTRPGYTRNIATPGSALQMKAWATSPLQYGGLTYNVRVHVSFDGGATYCPFATSCTITTAMTAPVAPMVDNGSRADEPGDGAVFLMWPNPNAGDHLQLTIDVLPEEVTMVQVDLFDPFGRKVMARSIPVAGMLNTRIDLDGSMANGMYLVTVTAGERTFTDRLIVH